MERKTKQKKIVKPKRYDTKVREIQERHGLKEDQYSEMKLGDYLKRQGYPALADMLKNA